MKKLLLSFFILSMSLSAIAKDADSDVQTCSEIRQQAKNSCKETKGSKQKKTCYQNEVDRMVDDSNSETADLPGGGELECEY